MNRLKIIRTVFIVTAIVILLVLIRKMKDGDPKVKIVSGKDFIKMYDRFPAKIERSKPLYQTERLAGIMLEQFDYTPSSLQTRMFMMYVILLITERIELFPGHFIYTDEGIYIKELIPLIGTDKDLVLPKGLIQIDDKPGKKLKALGVTLKESYPDTLNSNLSEAIHQMFKRYLDCFDENNRPELTAESIYKIVYIDAKLKQDMNINQ